MVTFTYMRPIPLKIDAREVLRDVKDRPHLLLRFDVRGGHFPHRAIEPFARVDRDGKPIEAHMVEVDDDERGMRAYFATDLPLLGNLTVGYGTDVSAAIPLASIGLEPQRLDEDQIVGSFHRVTLSNPGAFRPGRERRGPGGSQ